MYLRFEQIAVTATAKGVAELTIPEQVTGAELQAITAAIRYTMDGVVAATATVGMLLLTTDAPKYFNIEDVKNISFIRDAGAAELNIHYVAGRNIP